MRWLHLLFSTFMQLLFGLFAAGGVAGLIALVAEWRSGANDVDGGPLAAVGLLCVVALFVGVKGIFVSRKRGREAMEAHESSATTRREAIANVISGGALVAASIIRWSFSLWHAQTGGDDMSIWYAPMFIGLLQFGSGTVRGRSSAKNRAPDSPCP